MKVLVEDRKKSLKDIAVGEEVTFVKNENHPFDSLAIETTINDELIGYVTANNMLNRTCLTNEQIYYLVEDTFTGKVVNQLFKPNGKIVLEVEIAI